MLMTIVMTHDNCHDSCIYSRASSFSEFFCVRSGELYIDTMRRAFE
jgi:hypothetical protein